MTREFEQQIKSMPSFQKQVFIHGERLFIIENGHYKIAAIQFAWEMYQQQQKTIDEQQKRISELEESNLNRATHLDQVQKHNAKLQKRLQENGLEWKDLLEQALRGGQ